MEETKTRTRETERIVEELGKELDALDAGKWTDLTHINATAHVGCNMATFMALMNSRLRELGVIGRDQMFCITVEPLDVDGGEGDAA